MWVGWNVRINTSITDLNLFDRSGLGTCQCEVRRREPVSRVDTLTHSRTDLISRRAVPVMSLTILHSNRCHIVYSTQFFLNRKPSLKCYYINARIVFLDCWAISTCRRIVKSTRNCYPTDLVSYLDRCVPLTTV